MISATVDPATLQELAALQRTLALYGTVSKRSAIETAHKKADDLRIQLFRGYYGRRMKGSRKGAKTSRGVAFIEMRARARAGKGTKLREGRTLSPSAPLTDKKGRTLSTHQRLLWSELAARQAGQGVLGVAFLLRRWRSNSQGRTLRRNYTARMDTTLLAAVYQQHDRQHKKVLGEVRLTTTGAELSGFIEGHQQLTQRYGILPAALRSVRTDTETYLRRKLSADLTGATRASGLRAAA